MSLSIVIPCKADESRLMQTLASIAGTAPSAEIIVVFDGCDLPENLPLNVTAVTLDNPRGTQYARHVGIKHATGTDIFTCDAHMDFRFGWAELLELHLEAKPKSVSCFKMCAMEDGHESLMDARTVKKGAAFNWMTRDNSGLYQALVAQWADNKPGEISCVMGACYGFRKDWYLHMNQPWRLGTGWGCDEETISAVSWLCGGSVDLLDFYVGHYMGKPRRSSIMDGDMTWANRLRLIQMLPFGGDDSVDNLIAWLYKNNLVRLRLFAITEFTHYRDAFMFRHSTPWKRTIYDWIDHFELKPRKEIV